MKTIEKIISAVLIYILALTMITCTMPIFALMAIICPVTTCHALGNFGTSFVKYLKQPVTNYNQKDE